MGGESHIDVPPLPVWFTLLLIAGVFGLVAWMVNRYPDMNEDGWWAARAAFVASRKDDGKFSKPLYSVWRYAIARMSWLEDGPILPTSGLIMWSANAAPFLDTIIAKTSSGHWGVMQLDSTALPEVLEHLVRFDNTNSADVIWQWRVKMLGVPADLVDRPYRGQFN